ncbi:MAG TPA: dihydrodipicolinate synthase family protein [Verrucomicrobiae bacterium]|jgi:4-hydroxy-tetrahydrodipicolinate synthase
MLTGIIPPLITPLLGRDSLDVAGLERLIERTVSGGVSGLFLLGTTGEGASLSYRLRRELIERTCRQVNRRVPILVNITDTSFIETLNLARHAADSGAQALVVAPPYYLPPGQPELQEYLAHLIAELPLPLYLYNMPTLTKVSYELGTLRNAMNESRIVGIKDSSGNIGYFRDLAVLAKQRPDWSLLVGPEELLLDAIALGGHGGVHGGANLFPKLYVRLCEAARNGDASKARELHVIAVRVRASLYDIGRHPSSLIKGIKCALDVLGVCSDFMAEPFHRFRAEERAIVEQRLAELTAELSKLGLLS